MAWLHALLGHSADSIAVVDATGNLVHLSGSLGGSDVSGISDLVLAAVRGLVEAAIARAASFAIPGVRPRCRPQSP